QELITIINVVNVAQQQLQQTLHAGLVAITNLPPAQKVAIRDGAVIAAVGFYSASRLLLFVNPGASALCLVGVAAPAEIAAAADPQSFSNVVNALFNGQPADAAEIPKPPGRRTVLRVTGRIINPKWCDPEPG